MLLQLNIFKHLFSSLSVAFVNPSSDYFLVKNLHLGSEAFFKLFFRLICETSFNYNDAMNQRGDVDELQIVSKLQRTLKASNTPNLQSM